MALRNHLAGAMPAPSAFESMSRDDARRRMLALGLPRICGGEPTEEERKAAAEKAEKDRLEQERKDQEAEEAKLGDAGKEVLRKEREAKRKADADRAAEKERADKAEADRKALQDKLDKIERDAQKAKDEELAKSGEFKTLAEQRAEEVQREKERADKAEAERKALEDRLKAIDEAEAKRIDDGAKKLPDNLKAFDPGKDAPLATRKAWYDKALELFEKDKESGKKGNGGRPPASENNGKEPTPEQIAQNARRYE